MAEDRYPARRSRGLLAPVVGGLLLIGAVVLAIAFREPLWRFIKAAGETVGSWFTDWVPNHREQTLVILGFAVVAFLLNWIAHVRGRLRAWIFALVVEAGLWVLFWFSLGIPSLNELTGIDAPRMDGTTVAVSGAVVIAVTGAVFWFLETREEWRRYRRKQHVDED